VRRWSRNEKDFNDHFPEVVDSIAALKAESAIIDGEVVALDAKGLSSFQLLQARELGKSRPPLAYYAFDLLELNGEDLKELPVEARKAKLEKLLKKPPGIIRYSASLRGKADVLLKKAHALGLEGLIGKRPDSVYESGQRSGAWIKLKLVNEEEMVIGGYTDPQGARHHFGALLLGFYCKGKLHFAGKVGTGFDTSGLRGLYRRFQKLEQSKCPFVNLPSPNSSRYALTAAEMKRCHWLKPKLVCQVKFSEWTQDEKLRHPVFLGLREDKDAAEVVRE
jgi:bifunctional non-homologous end joining protein LigD